jgi:hypothetical protein
MPSCLSTTTSIGLYQRPLADFTRERDALAQRSGTDGGTIRRLQKPSAPAWAVNQVYWRRRKVIERLTSVSSRVRAAHERRLAGKDADVDLAEATHRSAVEAAVDAAAELLRGAGDPASEATLAAVRETFQTLVWSSIDGRLIRPLKASGLEAISALMKGPRPVARPAAKVLPIRPAAADRAETTRREAVAAAREAATLEKDLRAARAAEKEAGALVGRIGTAVDRATQELAKAHAAVEQATAALRERRADLHTARERANAAVNERQRIEARLSALRDQAG